MHNVAVLLRKVRDVTIRRTESRASARPRWSTNNLSCVCDNGNVSTSSRHFSSCRAGQKTSGTSEPAGKNST
jgi:hypothetical protein